MSNWFTKIFSTGASDLVESLGDAIDKNVTSDEERLILRKDLEKIGTSFKAKTAELEASYQEELTKRWQSDNQASALARNVRPLSLVYLLFIVTISKS